MLPSLWSRLGAGKYRIIGGTAIIKYAAYHEWHKTIINTQRLVKHDHQLKRNMSASPGISAGCLLGFGNPLLDITITADKELLLKYGLKANDAILAEERHHPLFSEALDHDPLYLAGGATQNTIRVAQWLLGKQYATSFFGCVGKDKNAEILKQKANEVGVNAHYQMDSEKKTGVCVAIITDQNRSLVTDLGAANHFTHHFLEQPENWDLVTKAKVIYVCGFPFSVSPKSVKVLAEHASSENKTLVMNLSATFLCHYFVDPQINIFPYIDIIFGNETEAAKFCELQGITAKDIQTMALEVSQLPKINQNRKRTVIFTQGRDPTIVAYDGKVIEHPVQQLEKRLIKDTNGCGDSFVGGFLSQYVQGKPLEDCLRCGKYAARVVLQNWGCTFPPKHDFE